MESTIGPERQSARARRRQSCRQINIKYPIIDNEQLAKLRHIQLDGFRSDHAADALRPDEGGAGLARAMAALLRTASDGGPRRRTPSSSCRTAASARAQAPIPSLLATAGVHHHLVREGLRTRCALVIESGDAREVHHVALLIGYGAGAVNPYLAFETLDDMIRQAVARGADHATRARSRLHQGAEQGHPQGHVEDGHLDAAELLRRPDLRGDRARAVVRRRYFTSTAVTDRRRSASTSSPRKCASGISSLRVPGAAAARTPDLDAGRRIPVAPRRRVPPVQPGDGVQAAARDAERAVQHLPRVHRRW